VTAFEWPAGPVASAHDSRPFSEALVAEVLLAVAASEADLVAARQQMALSLGWHIIIACFGVGLPLLLLVVEWRAWRTGSEVDRYLASRWIRGLTVLFAVGAVSGTILSFELGILWPGWMGTFGEVVGLPFAIEGIAFFLEAIFIGIYLYGRDRLPRAWHLATLVPIAIAGAASAWFVVTANAWMNHPAGFDVDHFLATGEVTAVDPWAAMLNPGTPVQTIHMILAAYLVTGFGVAAVHAWPILRGRGTEHHWRGLTLAVAFGAVFALPQVVVGDWAARFIADTQPTKLAAMEGLNETTRGAPLNIGGLYIDGEVRGGIEIPRGLSLLTARDPDAVVEGLDAVPEEDRPPVGIVRLAFQLMVAIGTALLALSAWFGWSMWRHRRPPTSKAFLWAVVASGPATVVALEAGWVTTEVGRQPWIVYGVMRVEEAITAAPNLVYGYRAMLVVYTLLTIGTVAVLRKVARGTDHGDPWAGGRDPGATRHDAEAPS
jgi:cytochrome d ubiquinol oxidase subunit I